MQRQARKELSLTNEVIWIDLENSPHVVFFKPIIEELRKRAYKVVVTARDCFQVCGLADRVGLPYKRIGRHYGKSKTLKVTGLFIRCLKLLPFALMNKPTLALSHGSRSQLLLSKTLGITSIIIGDYEHTQHLTGLYPTWTIAPELIPDNVIKQKKDRVFRYPGIKEDVYVPGFKPDPTLFNELGINRKDLLATIRPPATEAHYHNPESENLFRAAVEHLGQRQDMQMVLLPRNSRQEAVIRKQWPGMCNSGKILIPDHVVDGLNLIWYSDLVISGGGTMNREAAALGVPVYSIFRGRIGAVDSYLSDKGRLTLLSSVDDVYSKIVIEKRHRPAMPEQNNRLAMQSIVNTVGAILSQKDTVSIGNPEKISHG